MIKILAELKADIQSNRNILASSYFLASFINNQEIDQLEANVEGLISLSCKSL